MMRSRNTILSTLCIVICVIILAAGCGNPLNERQVASIQPLGLTDCYDCHVDANVTMGIDAIFEEWVQSRHANFDTANSTGDLATRPDPLDSSSYTYADIVGHPGITRSPFFNTDNSCSPCHMGPIDSGDHAGAILTTNVAGALFSNPNLGEVERYVIGCEACHELGHFNGASTSEMTVLAYDACTNCHAPLAGADHIDHHAPDSTHVWFNGSGGAIYDISGPSPVQTTVTLGSASFEAWLVSATWSAANSGPYYFNGYETINDTHYDQVWVTNEDDKVTFYDTDIGMFGYVDTTNSSPNTGMVRSDSPESCTASCHKAHLFNNFVNEQWFNGAHHPTAEGPLAVSRGAVVPSAPANWSAVNYNYSSGCLRCHNANGFAEIAPGYGDAVATASGQGSFLTCNACHDGEKYATSDDKAMRFSGLVALYDYNGGVLTTVDVGSSAVCVYCHQGREDSTRIDADIAAGTESFRSMHYIPAAATLFGQKGYEYTGLTYVGGSTHTMISSPCASCHMNDLSTPSKTVGGHTFEMTNGVDKNMGLCLSTCHPDMDDLDEPDNFVHTDDWAGDGATTTTAKGEIEALLTRLETALELYDGNDDSYQDVYILSSYPYFQLFHLTQFGSPKNDGTPVQSWDATLAKAAFNYKFIKNDPGAYAHNAKYAVQLLRDSYLGIFNDQPVGAASISALVGTRP